MTGSVALAILLAVVGPLALILCLLNRRDRREAALWTAMRPWLTGIDPELRGEIAVRIRVAIWRDRAVVIVDMRPADAHHVWHAIERLRRRLPRRTALRVKATTPDARDEACGAVGAPTRPQDVGASRGWSQMHGHRCGAVK